MDDVLASPFIGMRNDHQDALAAGLAVSEFSPSGKSADEIRDLWRWVDARLNGGIAAGVEAASEVSDVEFPIILSPEHVKAASDGTSTQQALVTVGEALTSWLRPSR